VPGNGLFTSSVCMAVGLYWGDEIPLIRAHGWDGLV